MMFLNVGWSTYLILGQTSDDLYDDIVLLRANHPRFDHDTSTEIGARGDGIEAIVDASPCI